LCSLGQFSKQIAKMADKSCTIRTRKFLTNRLLQRKQFVSAAARGPVARRAPDLSAAPLTPPAAPQVVDVLHPGRATVSKVAIAPGSGQAAAQRRARRARGVLKPSRPPQAEIREKLASMYDAKDPSCVFVFGFRTQVSSAAGPRAARRLPRRWGTSRGAGAARRAQARPRAAAQPL
jgi:hypothetical protein